MAHKMSIIGYGGMGRLHQESIREFVPELELVGVYDIRPEQLAVAEKEDHLLQQYEPREFALEQKMPNTTIPIILYIFSSLVNFKGYCLKQ